MALRARAFSTNDTENVVNPLQAKRGLQTSRGKKKASEFMLDSAHSNYFLLGTSNLQRSAFGELKNTTNRSASVDDKEFKEPLKPAQSSEYWVFEAGNPSAARQTPHCR